jgi:MFS transporter, PPP family, 3-phenylpropionic acid transporter
MNLNRSKQLGFMLLILNAFVYIPCSFYAPFLSSYFAKSGMNSMQIGVLMTIGPLVAIMIQPLWAIISDRSGRRNDVLSLLVAGSVVSLFSFYIGHSFLTFFLATFLLAVFSTAIFPLSDAIIINIANKNRYDFSKIRLGGTIGFSITVIIAGVIVKYNPSIQFVLGSIGYMFLLLLIRSLPKSDNVCTTPPLKSAEQIAKKKPGILSIFESGQIYFILIFAFISQIGLTFYVSFLGVYMTQLDYSEGMIGFINCVSAVSEIPVLLLINKVIRKINPTKILLLSSILMGLRILIVMQGSLACFVFAQALNGLTYMTIYFCCAVFISKNVKPINQSKGQSILTIVQAGIGSIVGNITGGYLANTFGLKMAYQYMAALIIGASALFAILQIFCDKSEGS